jgi:hypothetical protein
MPLSLAHCNWIGWLAGLQIAYGTTIAIRFINNVIGGENFIDMARWAGVQ